MGDLRLKFLFGQIAAVRFGQGQTVVLHVIAVSAFNLGKLIAAAGYHGHHIDPENILHTRAGDGAVVRLGQRIQTVDLGGRSSPGIDGFLAGGDDVDAAGDAFLHVIVNIPDKAEQGDDGHVGIALVQDLVRIIGDDDAGFHPQARIIAHVHPDNFGVHVDSAYDLRAVLIQITQGILCHFPASILDNLDFFHDLLPPLSNLTFS